MAVIEIYPNPARDRLTMELKDNSSIKIQKVTIANTIGEELKSIKLNNPRKETIDISELPAGFYLLFFDNIQIPPKLFSKLNGKKR